MSSSSTLPSQSWSMPSQVSVVIAIDGVQTTAPAVHTVAPAEHAAAAENEWLAVRLATPRAGWALFSGVRFSLEGRAKTGAPCHVVARRPGEDDA